MRKPRSFTCASARPRKSKTPSGPHPHTTQIPPRTPPPRYVQPPRSPRRYRLQTAVQYINPVIGQRTTDRDAQPGLVSFDRKANGIDRGFSRTIEMGDMRNAELA